MEAGYCKFCGQAYMVDADPEATEEELNELATAKCGCEGATYYAWKKSTLEVFAQDLEVVFGKENKEMKDLFADAGKMIMNGKMKALTIKQSDENSSADMPRIVEWLDANVPSWLGWAKEIFKFYML